MSARTLVPIGIFAAVVSVYVATLPGVVAEGDSAELTTAAATLGVPHPPGYPLYVLLGRAFAALPIQDVAYRLNLMSAVFGAITVVVVYALVFETTRNRLGAVVAALSLAFSYHLWTESLVAEVYTLDAALLAGILYALVLWSRTRHHPTLCIAFFLVGLSFANRTTSVLILFPILAWAVSRQAHGDIGALAKSIVWLVPGLTLYAFLPIAYLADGDMWSVGYDMAGVPLNANLVTRDGFTWFVTAEAFHDLAFAYGPIDAWAEVADYAGWLWGEFLAIGVGLGLIGLACAWHRHRAFFYLTAGTFLLQLIFYANYAAVDKHQMFLPTYLIWAVWIGLGVEWLIRLTDRSRAPAIASATAASLLVLMPFVVLAVNLPRVDIEQSYDSSMERLLSEAPTNAMVIGTWDEIPRLEYFQRVERKRTDLVPVNEWPFTFDTLVQFIDANVDRRPVYVSHHLAPLGSNFELLSRGSWFLVKRSNPEK